MESASDKVISPLQDLEDSLHPAVNYFIIPLFAFANAGIFLLDLRPEEIVSGVSLAVICGLVAGKFLGIIGFSRFWKSSVEPDESEHAADERSGHYAQFGLLEQCGGGGIRSK